LWQATQHAGVHPTLTGIVLALAFPSRDEKSADALKPWVYFCIVPLFAFFNAGINLRGVDASVINSVVFQGIFFGLLFGKFFGIASATFIVTRLHVCKLPDGVTWQHILGAAFLAGIGFTMSLFMSSLAFENATFIESTKVAVILASLVSGLIGYIILRSGRSDTS
jgi:NhaA family Na+:H+ antiporter